MTACLICLVALCWIFRFDILNAVLYQIEYYRRHR